MADMIKRHSVRVTFGYRYSFRSKDKTRPLTCFALPVNNVTKCRMIAHKSQFNNVVKCS